mmetsp:Transcript_5936/g.8012  ORF Transcript_5936/g.8012 Transcript_5936/m.8012 type:complete len:377 (-) Transcript_5936:449-1579(-)
MVAQSMFQAFCKLFDEVYRRAAFAIAWIINKPVAIYLHLFSKKARDKKKTTCLIFSPDGDDVIQSSLHEFETSQMSWEQWANLKTSPNSKEGEFVQTGGHEGAFESGGDTVKKLAAVAELAHYEKVNKAVKEGDAARSWPVKFMPAFFGVSESAQGKKQIVLENLLKGYSNPCIMDMKIGTETVDIHSKPKKIFRMMWRDTLTGSAIVGVKLVAMSVYHHRAQATTTADKKQSENISSETTLESILAYFLSDGDRIHGDLLEAYLEKLQALLSAFESNPHFHFVGSSLLFVYEGNPAALKAAGLKYRCDLRMIDFAHVSEGFGSVDSGYITGIKSLMGCLKTLEGARHLQTSKVNPALMISGVKRWVKAGKTKQNN